MLFQNKILVGLVCVIAVTITAVGLFYDVSYITRTAYSYFGGYKDSDASDANAPFRTEPLEEYLEKRAVRVREVDCAKLFQGDKEETRKAAALGIQPGGVPALPSDVNVSELAGNCSSLVHQRGFLMDPLTRLEQQFSIAFSLIVYKQASQVVDLLSAIYRPQNWYCLHVDRKSSPYFRHAMEAVSSCFPNVFVASRSVNVKWGFFTVLEPEIVCMQELWRRGRWKYLINLTGQEFPLRTNYELVRILQAYNGANDVLAEDPTDAQTNRWKKFLPAPHNITVYKGAVHIVASRAFVDYVLHSDKAQAFLNWCRPTRHPDEHFFNSLNHSPHLRVPGSSAGEVVITPQGRKTQVISPSVARFKMWRKQPCPGGKRLRSICILSIFDLPRMRASQYLFANKFDADYSRLALQCLAEDLRNRTKEQALGRLEFNVTFYEQLPFVRNRLWL